jgi:serine/threonine-protein kinase
MADQLALDTPPRDLSDFRVLQVLAEHHGTSVALAAAEGHFGLSRLVLLKTANTDLHQGLRTALRLTDEARLGLRLRHPNLLATYELGRDGNRFFLIREWVEGLGLRRLLCSAWEDGGPSPAATLLIGQELCSALDYLHGLSIEPWAPSGIVHHGVVPSNIIITSGGEVRLANLYMARPTGKASALLHDNEIVSELPPGAAPAYRAPELERDAPADGRADLFSLGAVLYEALVGPEAFGGDPDRDWSRHSDDADVLNQLEDSDLPLSVRSILERAMAPLPSDRYATARELRTDLQEANRKDYGSSGAEELRSLARAQSQPTVIRNHDD